MLANVPDDYARICPAKALRLEATGVTVLTVLVQGEPWHFVPEWVFDLLRWLPYLDLPPNRVHAVIGACVHNNILQGQLRKLISAHKFTEVLDLTRGV